MLFLASFLSCLYNDQESLCLKNLRQVTSTEMGFAKAGESYFSPESDAIIFQAVLKGETSYQIYTLDIHTEELRRVSTGEGACTCGFFHPKGNQILFASSHRSPLPLHIPEKKDRYEWDLTPYMNIYIANRDGTDLQSITSGSAYHAECAFSSDGKKIVYASNETGSMNLYCYDLEERSSTQLTFTNHSYNGGPFFSPDGKWIVFRSDRKEKDRLQIFMIASDGTKEIQLTDNDHVNWAPYWHPNGKIIAYTTSKHGHHAYQIYLMHVETREEYRLTYSNAFEGLPSFNREGTKITWTSQRGDGSSQILIADFMLPTIFQETPTCVY